MIASWKENNDKPGQGIEEQRHYSGNKSPYSQGYGFPTGHIQLWELDHKEGRMPNNWCLQTVVLERTLENPLTARRWNQSIWKKINPEYSLKGLMLKLKLQYFGHMMWTDDSWKSLMLGKIEGRRRTGIKGWDGWTALLMEWTWTWTNSGRRQGTGRPGMLLSMGSQKAGHDWMTEQQQQRER